MSLLSLDDNCDLEIVDNGFVLVEKKEEVRQRLLQNLRTWLGEWFLDVSIGVPYFETVFVKGTSPSAIDSVFIDAILRTVGVTELTRYEPLDLTEETRTLNVDFDVLISDEIVSVNEDLT